MGMYKEMKSQCINGYNGYNCGAGMVMVEELDILLIVE